MKFIHLIFVLYMVALAVYPCYEDNCMEEVCLANETEESHNQEKSADFCTPFCISACCTLQILSTVNFSIKPDIQNAVAQNSAYTNKFTPQVIVSIWQPPKLA